MSGSLRRIRQLAVLFGLGLVVVALHLGQVMVVEHETWLSRSYQNRWAFRDVPSRRGSVLDRNGCWLAEDQPCTALALHYWAFRRYDPVGAAVEGANLARGGAPQLDYHHSRKAFRILLRTRVDRLQAEVSGADLTRDLGFYLGSLFSSLTNATHSQIRSRLREAAKAGSREPVHRVLGLDPLALEALFEAHLGELLQLDRWLGAASHPRRRSLWQVLNAAREARQTWRPSSAASGRVAPEQRLLRVDDQLPYEAALYLASIRERHPGLLVYPSVRRVRNTLPGRSNLASLEPLLGRVRAFGSADQERRDKRLLDEELDRLTEELDELPEGDAELSDRLQQQVRDRACKAVKGHLRSRGRVGNSGVERELDSELRGGPGLRFVERSRRVRERRMWGSFNVTPGTDRRLTFDLRLQALLEQAMDEALAGLAEEPAAAMAVIDPNGDVLALASRQPPDRIPAALEWPTAGDIGSVGKPFVLLEHLDAMRHGRPHRPHHDYRECVGSYGPRLGCDHSHEGDARDPVRALGESCNFFFYQAAEGLSGVGVLSAYGRFGLALECSNRQAQIPGLWLRNPVGQSPQIPQRWAIGYGIQANVLSIARAYAALATGKLPGLSFVLEGERPEPVDLGLHSDDLEVVRDGLEYCVREGTAAREAGLRELGVLAKTGTATVGKSTSKINNAWLAGYLTRERPTLAFAAVVYRVRGYGATRAGPLVTAFLEKLQNDQELREIYL